MRFSSSSNCGSHLIVPVVLCQALVNTNDKIYCHLQNISNDLCIVSRCVFNPMCSVYLTEMYHYPYMIQCIQIHCECD